MTTCKVCNRSLVTQKERGVGMCAMCTRMNKRCIQCGEYLLPGNVERQTGVCLRCRLKATKCKKCGKELYGDERTMGVCNKCRRGF